MDCPVLPPFMQVLKIGAEDIPTLQANLFFQERSSMKTTEAQWEGMYTVYIYIHVISNMNIYIYPDMHISTYMCIHEIIYTQFFSFKSQTKSCPTAGLTGEPYSVSGCSAFELLGPEETTSIQRLLFGKRQQLHDYLYIIHKNNLM